MPKTVISKTYYCEYCNRGFAKLEDCESHVMTCQEERKKTEMVYQRTIKIDKNTKIFYAMSPCEVSDYNYGHINDFAFEDLEYPRMLVIKETEEKIPYENYSDTIITVIDYVQYINKLKDAESRLLDIAVEQITNENQ